jgi:hypothetical protein
MDRQYDPHKNKDSSHPFIRDQHIKLTGSNSELKTGVSFSNQPGHEQNLGGKSLDEGKFITQEGRTELKNPSHNSKYEKSS